VHFVPHDKSAANTDNLQRRKRMEGRVDGSGTTNHLISLSAKGALLVLMVSVSLFGSPAFAESLVTAQMSDGAAAQPPEAKETSTDELSVMDKLLDAQQIIEPLEQGEETVRVIVNLVEPERVIRTARLSTDFPREERQYEIAAIETSVLSALALEVFRVRHVFENQASFSGEVTAQGLAQLLNDPGVESIEPDYLLERHTAQGIPLINATLFRQTYNGQGVAVAVIDDGFDYTHPKLGGGGFPNSKVIGGYDFGELDDDPAPGNGDLNFHGTPCAGIAVGDVGNMGDYIGGVASGAKLYALKVSEANGDIYSSSAIRALDWCVSNKNKNPQYPILVISISSGHGRYFDRASADNANPSYTRAVRNAIEAGITIVASSGNEGYCDSLKRPAALTDVISVGAVYDAAFTSASYPCVDAESCATKFEDSMCTTGYYAIDHPAADIVPSYSNTASFLDVLAPASVTHTLDVVGSQGLSYGDYFSMFGGTSAACPYTAGAVACLQSASKATTGRYLSPAEVRDLLTATGDSVTDNKPTPNITRPRINLGLAISSISNSTVMEYFSADAPKAISDHNTVTSTLVIPDVGDIVDLDVRLNITHTYDADLDVYLVPPSGSPGPIELFTDIGGSGDDFRDTILDDEAPLSIAEGMPPFTGSYRPEGPFVLPDDVAGTWTLEITDDGSGDVGTLNSWSLIVEAQKPSCPIVVSSYPYQEDFENGLGDWINVAKSDDMDWLQQTGPTSSSDTGPSAAFSGTFYLYVEASGQDEGFPNKTAVLQSPCFEIPSKPASAPQAWHYRLGFSYHMYGAMMGTLAVEISESTSGSWTQVWSRTGDQGDIWHQADIDLSSNYDGKTIQLRFTGTTGTDYTSDIAIDDVSIEEQVRPLQGSSLPGN
jgi:subtilisin-like proprotein convertase family protein